MNPINKNAYFESREAVGIELAKQLEYLKTLNPAVLAVSPGGLIIASEISKRLGCRVSMLQLRHVEIPGDADLGVMSSSGNLTYNRSISEGEIEEYNTEYRNSIAASKFNAMHQLHVMSGQGEINPKS